MAGGMLGRVFGVLVFFAALLFAPVGGEAEGDALGEGLLEATGDGDGRG